MPHRGLVQTDDLTAAAWIAPRLGAFGSGVRGIIPAGFEAYARILHPASADGDWVRWSEVAATCGRVAHPLMQFHALVGASPEKHDITSGPWEGTTPDNGELEPESLEALLDVLAGHTATLDRCWFCLWEGYGWTRDAIEYDACVELPKRTYVLFSGSLRAALELGHSPLPNWFLPQSPNIFWPDDVSWCVATEIDLFCTYVGGSRALIDDLLADDRLEVWEASLDDPVTHDSDRLNC